MGVCVARTSPQAVARDCQRQKHRQERARGCRCGCGTCRAASAGMYRAPPSYGDVLGPGRLDGVICPHGPEDLREIISAYQKCVAETVRRFGGFVAK